MRRSSDLGCNGGAVTHLVDVDSAFASCDLQLISCGNGNENVRDVKAARDRVAFNGSLNFSVDTDGDQGGTVKRVCAAHSVQGNKLAKLCVSIGCDKLAVYG